VLSYAVVTPARNERANLDRLAESLIHQALRPAQWIVVDDGSDDGTPEAVADLAAQHSWIGLLRHGERGGSLSEGRREGRDLTAFRAGIAALRRPADVVVKLDADTSFDEQYFAGLIGRFEEDPLLGIASGACWELEDGRWQRRKVAITHPRGASRAYRWSLVDDVMALEPTMGWDGVDEIKAQLRGYRTRTFVELGFKHHRPVGDREGRVRAGSALGRQAWYMGYRPSYLLLRALYRAMENPASAAMLWGYASSAASRAPRCPDPDVLRRVRDGQRLRVALRVGAPP
jgi:glycosyltransferase involved in cell wall biosynthesis